MFEIHDIICGVVDRPIEDLRYGSRQTRQS